MTETSVGKRDRGCAGSRRNQIHVAAIDLFSERGYYGTSMEDIANQVGIGTSSLYNHVSSKQEMLAEIMTQTMRELHAQFKESVAGYTSPPGKLRAVIEGHVVFNGTRQREVHISNREITSLQQPTRDKVRHSRRCYAHNLLSLILEGIESGDFVVPHPRLSSYGLIEMGMGVAQWYRPNGPLDLAEIAKIHGDMALRQVSTR